MESKAAFLPKEVEKRQPSEMDRAITTSVFFIAENLPEIDKLKKMQENDKQIFEVGKETWALQVTDDVAIIPNGQKGNIKIISLTNERDKTTQLGIITEEDFDTVFGSMLGNMFIRLTEPFSLQDLMNELKSDNKRRISESFDQTHDVRKTAVELNLRPDYVSQLVPLATLK